MAVESSISIGADKSPDRKTYKVVDCRLIIDRPYDKSTPTGFTSLENLEVTLSPDHGDTFFHKWFTDKSREEVTLTIMLHFKESFQDERQKFKIKDAFCQSLSESFEKTGKDNVIRRLLTVGIKGKSIELDNQDLQILRKKRKADDEGAAKKKAEPVFVAKDQSKDALIRQRAAEMKGNLTEYEKLKLAEHSIAIEKALKVKKGKPMSIEEAQKANPKFVSTHIRNTENKSTGAFVVIDKDTKGQLIEKKPAELVPRWVKNPQFNEEKDRKYTINCATCATAYVLRQQGFDVHAQPKTDQNKQNMWLSKGNVLKVWKNIDGTDAKPATVTDWMKEKGVYKMTPALYNEYLEENTKEEGTYIMTVAWPGNNGTNDGGHATIIQRWRDEDGNLHLNRIEPQVFDGPVKRDVSEITTMATPWPPNDKGILRVDNKLYDTKLNKLFEK